MIAVPICGLKLVCGTIVTVVTIVANVVNEGCLVVDEKKARTGVARVKDEAALDKDKVVQSKDRPWVLLHHHLCRLLHHRYLYRCPVSRQSPDLAGHCHFYGLDGRQPAAVSRVGQGGLWKSGLACQGLGDRMDELPVQVVLICISI
jgi:hypothetical protein